MTFLTDAVPAAAVPRSLPVSRRVEWPTCAVAAGVYGGWMLLTWCHDSLSPWLAIPAGAWLLAWHAALQHEIIHGHPTPWRRVNTLLGIPPLALWLPFALYRSSHLAHHRDALLTDPVHDPESFFVTPATWDRLGPVLRAVLWLHQTLPGRLVLGPPLAIGRFLALEAGALARGRHLGLWLRHGIAAALVLAWVVGVCGISPGRYILLAIYPGQALLLLRSFAEHRLAEDPAGRTVVVEAEPPLALLFLNNNLHVAHHRLPHLPWYRLPAAFRALRQEGAVIDYRGYRSLIRRHLLRPLCPPVWCPSAAPSQQKCGVRGRSP